MRQLRASVIVLLFSLTVLFNIERLDIIEQNVIDLDTFVYVLTIAAVLAIVALPVFRRMAAPPTVAIGLGVYALGKLVFLNGRPLLGGIHTYQVVTEVALLSINIWLAQRVAHALLDFEEAVQNITMEGVSRQVKPLDQSTEDVQTELIRSRRHNRPLSVVVVKPDPASIQVTLHRTVLDVQRAMMMRYVVTGHARVLRTELRRTDVVMEERDQDRFVILCPETDAAGSTMLAERIRATIEGQLGVKVACGIASFPDEALTFDELVHRAESQLVESAALPASLPLPHVEKVESS